MRRAIRTAIIASLMTAAATTAQAQSLRFSGFGDFVFGANGGGKADAGGDDKFEAVRQPTPTR